MEISDIEKLLQSAIQVGDETVCLTGSTIEKLCRANLELLSLKQQNEWIPVSPETMPRGGELVLLWDSWELCIESGFLTRDADEVATFRLERSNPQDELIEYGIERVTKWQHYPSPPIAHVGQCHDAKGKPIERRVGNEQIRSGYYCVSHVPLAASEWHPDQRRGASQNGYDCVCSPGGAPDARDPEHSAVCETHNRPALPSIEAREWLALIDELGVLTATVERCTEQCLPPEVVIAHGAAKGIMQRLEKLRDGLLAHC